MGRRRLPVVTRRFDAAALERELRAQPPAPRAASPKLVSEVVRRHVRLQTNGRPVRCCPSPSERDRTRVHSDGKVIFDSFAAARACVLELRELSGDATPIYVYGCNRSRRGHLHITRKRTSEGKKV